MAMYGQQSEGGRQGENKIGDYSLSISMFFVGRLFCVPRFMMCGTQLREVWREVEGEGLEQEEEAIYKDLRVSCLFNGLPTWLGRGLRLLGPSLYLLDSSSLFLGLK